MTDRRTLTATDIRAMRAADSFALWIDGDIAQLRLGKRAKRAPSDPFRSFATDEGKYDILCDLNSITTGSTCGLYTPPTLRALALIVRPGDCLRWAFRTNNNGYADAAIIPAGTLDHDLRGYDRLFCDELVVTVIRRAKTGRETCILSEFVMAHSLTPDNSARMRRPVSKIPISA